MILNLIVPDFILNDMMSWLSTPFTMFSCKSHGEVYVIGSDPSKFTHLDHLFYQMKVSI